jgi:predicted transcriptional regulator
MGEDSQSGWDQAVMFTLTAEEEAELLLSIAEADRGETIPAEEVLAKLARRHG